MGSLERHDGYLHNAETIAKVSPKLNIKLHEWNKPSTTDDDDSMSHPTLWERSHKPPPLLIASNKPGNVAVPLSQLL